MTLKLPFWPPIHKLLVQNKSIIYKLFILAYIFSSFLIVFGFYVYSSMPGLYPLLYELAGNFGTLALLIFLGTLMPGIFGRFKVFPLLSASIILFRRQFGILMYFLAMIHAMYISTIPAIINNTFSLQNLPSNGLTGVITLSILFPVWITSNDISQKNLGKFWKTIQRLTYFAMIFLFFHVALVEFSNALMIAAVFTLELASWIKVWFFKPKKIEIQDGSTQLEA